MFMNIIKIKKLILKTRFIGYFLLFGIISWFLFNFLLNKQSTILYKYFIEKPSSYNVERAKRLASSVYKSFKQEVSIPSINNIEKFIEKYNNIPFLSVNFIYTDKDGILKSIFGNVEKINILEAKYVYSITYLEEDIGTLIIHDIKKEYEKGIHEYQHIIYITKIFFVIFLVMLLFIFLFREYNTIIREKRKIAEYQAVHDGLTGLYTQKYFKEYLEKEIERSQRYKYPISLILCDIDYFKKFNDTYGHLEGDRVLQIISNIIKKNVRSSDIVARYGGEEFAILLIETRIDPLKDINNIQDSLMKQTIEIAERIKEEIEYTKISIEDKKVNATISMGISLYNSIKKYKITTLIKEADMALYKSKEGGRNQITFFDAQTKQFEKIL